jgi:plastocyanin
MSNDNNRLTDQARRNVLKVLGTGSALLTIGGGRAAASPDGSNAPDEESGDDNNGRGNGKRAATIDNNLGYTQYDPDNVVPFENRVAETVNLNIRAGTYLLTDDSGEIQTDDDGNVLTEKRAAPNSEEPDGLGPKDRLPQPPVVTEDTLGFEFYFDPVALRITPGDIVEFQIQVGHHAIVSYHPDNDRQRRIPEEADSFASPMLGGAGNEFNADEGPSTGLDDIDRAGKSQKWYYQFEEEGIYDLYCPSHEQFGMVMRMIVLEEGGNPTELEQEAFPSRDDLGFEGREFLAFLPPQGFANPVLGWPNLQPETVVNKYDGSVAWNELFIGPGGLEDTDGPNR